MVTKWELAFRRPIEAPMQHGNSPATLDSYEHS